MDNLDKLVASYGCQRATACWPMVFHNVLDVSADDAFVLWRENSPNWMMGKRHKRSLFLEALGKALMAPLIRTRTRP